MFALHLDESMEFQWEAISWGQGYVRMGVERSSVSDGGGGLKLGKSGMYSRKKIYTRRLQMQKVQLVTHFQVRGPGSLSFACLIELTGPQMKGGRFKVDEFHSFSF